MQAVNEVVIFILTQLYGVTGSLAVTIIIFTIGIRSILLPLSIKSLRAAQKMKELQPEIKKLKKKHKDAKKLQQKQMELYQKYNVNPLAGCLPQIVQLAVFIVLYRVFFDFLGDGATAFSNISIFGISLLEADSTRILPVVAAITQLALSVMIAPGAEVRDIESNAAKSKKKQKANEQEEDVAEMAASMQQQMIYIFPIMTGFIALSFPAGLVLYWITATLFSIAQQYYISGWGGLATYSQKAVAFITKTHQKE